MENSFVKSAIAPEDVRTTNGMRAKSKTGSSVLDLFAKIGVARGRDLSAEISTAFAEDRDLTARVVLWARDVLEGAGERQTFRNAVKFVEKYDRDLALAIMKKIPELGRIDDLLFSFEILEQEAYELYASYLLAGNNLAFKWAPREKSSKKVAALKLMKILGFTPTRYRKFLSAGTSVVENDMSAKTWSNINYSHVPSVASMRYKKAFAKNDGVRYGQYLAELTKPVAERDASVKMNAKAIFPHDVVHNCMRGDVRAADAMWEALPNFVGTANVLPIVDTSGSMMVDLAGRVSALEVAISLGLYFSYKNAGPFKDLYLTFSSSSQFNYLKGTLTQRIEQMQRDNKWGGSTDLHSAFEKILETALKNSVKQEDMPNYLLILSDMQFNYCARYDDSAIEMMRRKYSDAGYEMPSVIFWNLCGTSNNVPVEQNEKGVALLNGFSPAAVKGVLEADAAEFSPYGIMMKTIMKDRYNIEGSK